MNVAQGRSRTWSPHVIVFAVVLHVIVLYYIAVTFKILPSPLPTPAEPQTVQAVRYDPPPPIPQQEQEPIKEHPRFVPRQPRQPPQQVDVPPLPLPPQQPAESTANATVMTLNTTIPEEPASRALPPYPRIAQERGIEGRVVLSITILPDGTVQDVEIVSAQPRGYFEEAAMRSVRNWRYKPSNLVRTRVIVHMDFVLRG